MHAKEHEKKKRKKKIAHTFKIKGTHQKERVMIKGVQKLFRIRKIIKFHTLALLDQSI